MDEKSKTKRPKEDEQSKTERLKDDKKKRADRLKVENEINITVISGIKNPPKGKILYKHTKDISASGTKIEGNVLLPIDTVLQIDLILRNLNQKVTAFGKVKWNKVVVEGQTYEAGVEFVDTSGETIQKLEDYIKSKQKFTSLNPVGVPFWIFAKFNSDKLGKPKE